MTPAQRLQQLAATAKAFDATSITVSNFGHGISMTLQVPSRPAWLGEPGVIYDFPATADHCAFRSEKVNFAGFNLSIIIPAPASPTDVLPVGEAVVVGGAS
jgi:hypothetical protein